MPPPDLAHLAASVARFSTGWELLHDAPVLTRLAGGRVELDLVRGACRHQAVWRPPLIMAGILRARITSALLEVEQSWEVLRRAELHLAYSLRETAEGSNPRVTWARYDGPFLRCTIEATIHLATLEGAWTHRHQAILEWPRDWALR